MAHFRTNDHRSLKGDHFPQIFCIKKESDLQIKILDTLFVRHNVVDQSKQSIWFLHGFADSGLAYKEVFESSINGHFNIYVVDLPGFGVSPLNPTCIGIKQQAELLSKVILKETSQQDKVNIIAHSLGALIGTWVCQTLTNKINCYVSIEGNLTEADSYFSSKPLKFDTAQEFATSFQKEIFEIAKKDDRFKRYYSSIRFANPEAMRNWGFSSQEHIKGNKCGYEFKDLPGKKLYIWGDVDTPEETRDFIKTHEIPHQMYPGIGHWHMIENAGEFYSDINRIIKTGRNSMR